MFCPRLIAILLFFGIGLPLPARMPYNPVDNPATDVTQHSVVHDEMKDGSICVAWCVSCNTSVVFRAENK